MIKALPRLQKRTETPAALSPTIISLTLIMCGAGSFWLYHWARDLHRFTQGISGYTFLFIAQFAIYLLACYFAMRIPSHTSRKVTLLLAAIILIFAAAFRFDLVAQRPYLSTDIYRYIWDGRVQAAGINPYRYVPSAPELANLRDEKIYPYINRRDYGSTPYPPGAQVIFLAAYLLHPSSVTSFKVLLSLFDLLTILAVMIVFSRTGKNPAPALLFAWHPLLIYEGAHSGHIESGFIVFLALALLAWNSKKPTLTGIGLALATLVKYYPAMLLPAFLLLKNPDHLEGINDDDNPSSSVARTAPFLQRVRRLFEIAGLKSLINAWNIKLLSGFVLTVGLVHLPYLLKGSDATGSLENEFSEEGFTGKGGRYFLLQVLRIILPVPTNLFVVIAGLAIFALGWWWLLQNKRDAVDVARAAISLIGLYFFIVTPRYHWYYAWILPFLCFAPRLGWLYLTGATVLLYALWFTPLVYPEIPIWLGVSIYAPTLMFLVWESWKEKPRSTS
jgi:alpha-1,6-mannosyltransferase